MRNAKIEMIRIGIIGRIIIGTCKAFLNMQASSAMKEEISP